LDDKGSGNEGISKGNLGRCVWLENKKEYMGGHAAGDGREYNIEDGQKRCLQLGIQCRGVTCKLHSPRCTVRTGPTLHHSGGERTFTYGLADSWKEQFQRAGFTGNFCDLTFENGEWFYQNKPTCVGKGSQRDNCDRSKLICAGGAKYGSEIDQANRVQEYIASGAPETNKNCPTTTSLNLEVENALGEEAPDATSLLQSFCIIASVATCGFFVGNYLGKKKKMGDEAGFDLLRE